MQEQGARTLVIGATGRIGTVLRRFWPSDAALWQSRVPRDGFVRFDPLGEPERFAAAAAVADGILCLAGVVPAAARGCGLGANVTLARAAVKAAARAGTRVVLASSAAVYGNRSVPLVETAGLRPDSEYGRSKAESERAAAELAAREGVPVTALRIGNIAGLDAILGGWQEGFRLDRFPDGRTPRRSYIGVETLARTLRAVLSVPDLPPVLNVAEPGVIEMGDLLDAAGLEWSARPAPAEAIAQVELDVSRLRALCGLPSMPGAPDRMVREWQIFREERTPA